MRGPGFALALVLVSGCAGPSAAPAATSSTTILVTAPDDYDEVGGETAYHLHDYWQGLERLPLLDTTVQGELGMAYAPQVEVAHVRPPSDRVVPQGAGRVDATVELTPHPLDQFRDPELWVRTAADNVARFAGDIESGRAITVPATNETNDLPHQRLSAWWFEVRLRPPNDAVPIRYNGRVAIQAESVRGTYPIPLYPGHPDRWQNATDIHLFSARGAFEFTTADRNLCMGMCIPTNHTALPGAVVPRDHDRVEALLTFELDTPNTLGLAYHASDARELKPLRATKETEGHRTYEVREAEPDGPYARQTLWDFALALEGEPRVVRGTYGLEVHVLRGP